MSLYRVAILVWESVPERLKRAVRSKPTLNTLKHWLKYQSGRLSPFDEVYSSDYFGWVDRVSRESLPVIAQSILYEFRPASVLDVGCGTGRLLQALAQYEIRAVGLDNSEAAVAYCQQLGLQVQKMDLRRPTSCGEFDVVVSLEVAEHLPPSFADSYLDFLCASGKTVILTAATPGQGGTGHLNEKPHEYWIRKMQARKYRYLAAVSDRWRANWREKNVAVWYWKNVMVFQGTGAD